MNTAVTYAKLLLALRSMLLGQPGLTLKVCVSGMSPCKLRRHPVGKHFLMTATCILDVF